MTTVTDNTNHAAWATALEAHDAAVAAYASVPEDADDQTHEALWDVQHAALVVLANTRAPDVAAMVEKTRRIINAMPSFADESADDPETISMLLGGNWLETIAAAILQDGLTMLGQDGPLTTAEPKTFNARAWVQQTERRTGARLTTDKSEWVSRFVGGDEETANGLLKGLRSRPRDAVHSYAVNR